MNSKLITKEFLIREYGITDVSKDGVIYVNGEPVSPFPQVKAHPYGEDVIYYLVNLKSLNQKKAYNFKGTVRWWSKWDHIMVHRVVWAWYNGECKAGLTIDHLDGDTSNNALSNLEEVLPETNLKRKKKTANEITNKYNYQTVLGYREFRRSYAEQAAEIKEDMDLIKRDLAEAKRNWHSAELPDLKETYKLEIYNYKCMLAELRKKYRVCNDLKTIKLGEYATLEEGGY